MTDDWRVVFESRNNGACSDRALVLTAVSIPFDIIHDQEGCALVVPAEYSAAAVAELQQYEAENPPPVRKPAKRIPNHDAMPGIFGYTLVVCVVAWFAGNAAFGEDWLAAGRIDGELIRDGQWWRLVTALTLHSGVKHLLGNLVFGALFGLFAGRLLGSGIAWFSILATAVFGNLLNTLLLDSAHRSIGASTAVFAALGLVAGYVWRAKLMSQERWAYRFGPIIGGLALLMYTGTGDANTDIGAHLMGFLSGFAGGMLMTISAGVVALPRVQWLFGIAAIGVIALAWIIGLSHHPAIAIM